MISQSYLATAGVVSKTPLPKMEHTACFCVEDQVKTNHSQTQFNRSALYHFHSIIIILLLKD